MPNFTQAVKNSGLIEAIRPEAMQKAIRGASLAHDEFGNFVPNKVAPFRQPITMDWIAADEERIRAPRAGTGILLASHASTAPGSGQLIIRLYSETETSGESLVWTHYHPQGQRIFEEPVSLPVLAGSWWSCNIQSAGGASNVSVSFVINVG